MKKYIIIILLLINSGSYGQWKYKTTNNPFDGQKKIGYIVGKGTNSNHKNPTLVVAKLVRTNTIEIYITDAGYLGNPKSYPKILVKVDGKDKLKQYFGASSADNDKFTWFFDNYDRLYDNNKYRVSSIYQMLDIIIKQSILYIRLGDKDTKSINDIEFSLKGSTRALNYVLGYDWTINKQIEKEKKRKELLRKEDSIVREFKRKEDSILRVNKNKKLREKLREKRLKDSISLVIRKERIKQNRLKCRKLLSEFSGTNYECYDFNGKEVRRKMQYPDSAIKVKEGTVLIIDNEFKNRAFYKVCLIDGLSKFTSYAFKKDLEKTR